MQVKTKNMIVGALVVLLVSMLWYRVVYSPMESKASKAKTAAHDADTSAANLRQALAGTSSNSKKNKAQDVSTQKMLAGIPLERAQASFLRSLDALRVSSGALWQSVTPSAPTVSGTVTSMTVAITAAGTEDQVARYVAGLSALKRVFVLDNLTITKGGSTSAAGTVTTGHAGAVFFGDVMQLQISGRIFSQPAAPAAATTGTGSPSGSSTTPTTGAPAPTGGAAAPNGNVNG